MSAPAFALAVGLPLDAAWMLAAASQWRRWRREHRRWARRPGYLR